ncbi:hypothetical protein JCM10908_006251 [Rhodotorula pacifica]|uniref:uncharacterized protein n=1 Tax=Rhodotorula pacifica TaxID=1495444 RepID=UPI0031737C5F
MHARPKTRAQKRLAAIPPLPTELIRLILDHAVSELSVTERRTLLRLMTVSKAWLPIVGDVVYAKVQITPDDLDRLPQYLLDHPQLLDRVRQLSILAKPAADNIAEHPTYTRVVAPKADDPLVRVIAGCRHLEALTLTFSPEHLALLEAATESQTNRNGVTALTLHIVPPPGVDEEQSPPPEYDPLRDIFSLAAKFRHLDSFKIVEYGTAIKPHYATSHTGLADTLIAARRVSLTFGAWRTRHFYHPVFSRFDMTTLEHFSLGGVTPSENLDFLAKATCLKSLEVMARFVHSSNLLRFPLIFLSIVPHLPRLRFLNLHLMLSERNFYTLRPFTTSVQLQLQPLLNMLPSTGLAVDLSCISYAREEIDEVAPTLAEAPKQTSGVAPTYVRIEARPAAGVPSGARQPLSYTGRSRNRPVVLSYLGDDAWGPCWGQVPPYVLFISVAARLP